MTEITPDLTSLTGLALLRYGSSLPEPPQSIGRLLGMHFTILEEGQVEMELDTRPDFSNPLGSVHGGICATLLDSVMGCAVHSTLGPGVGYTTLELKVNYIRTVPVTGETLRAVGNIIHVGGRTATAEGRVLDSADRLVAHGTTTCMVFR